MTDPLDRLVAHDEIRQLVARYAVAVDSRDIDGLCELFVPDVRVGRSTGREALHRDFTAQLRAVGRTMLHVGTQVIDVVDADHATGTVYCRGEIEVDGAMVHQAILYDDTYRRVGRRWLFERRTHELWYGAPVGQDPLGLPPAEWPLRAVGMGTVPERWNTWQRFWAE